MSCSCFDDREPSSVTGSPANPARPRGGATRFANLRRVTQPMDPRASTLHTDVAAPLPDAASPILDAAALAELAPFGEERAIEVGDMLFRAGEEPRNFFVILEGAVDIVRPDIEGETVLTTHVAGRFLGELNMVTGTAPVRQRTRDRTRSGARDSQRRVPPGDEQQAGSRRHHLLGLRRPPRSPAERRRCACGADHRLPLLERSDGVALVRGPVSSPAHVDRHRGRERRRRHARGHGVPDRATHPW